MKTALSLAALALVVTLTACGGGANTVVEPEEPKAAPAETTAPSSTPTTGAVAFGQTVEFPDGVQITVSQPVVMPVSQYAAGAVEGQAVVFDLSVTNGSPEPIEPFFQAYPDVTYGEAGLAAQTTIDIEAGLTGDTMSTVLPSETQTVKLGYGIPSAEFGNVRVEVTATNVSYDPAIFKGSVQ